MTPFYCRFRPLPWSLRLGVSPVDAVTTPEIENPGLLTVSAEELAAGAVAAERRTSRIERHHPVPQESGSLFHQTGQEYL